MILAYSGALRTKAVVRTAIQHVYMCLPHVSYEFWRTFCMHTHFTQALHFSALNDKMWQKWDWNASYCRWYDMRGSTQTLWGAIVRIDSDLLHLQYNNNYDDDNNDDSDDDGNRENIQQWDTFLFLISVLKVFEGMRCGFAAVGKRDGLHNASVARNISTPMTVIMAGIVWTWFTVVNIGVKRYVYPIPYSPFLAQCIASISSILMRHPNPPRSMHCNLSMCGLG